jgi:hypothetical protein
MVAAGLIYPFAPQDGVPHVRSHFLLTTNTPYSEDTFSGFQMRGVPSPIPRPFAALVLVGERWF